jgi:hypothetical protein
MAEHVDDGVPSIRVHRSNNPPGLVHDEHQHHANGLSCVGSWVTYGLGSARTCRRSSPADRSAAACRALAELGRFIPRLPGDVAQTGWRSDRQSYVGNDRRPAAGQLDLLAKLNHRRLEKSRGRWSCARIEFELALLPRLPLPRRRRVIRSRSTSTSSTALAKQRPLCQTVPDGPRGPAAVRFVQISAAWRT